MGFLNDLGTSIVETIDEQTGYPKDQYGRLLDPISPVSGKKESGWGKPGTELYNLTNPYGHLHFAVGSGDDFWCFDYAIITGLRDGAQYLIIDATINSETGSFIESGGYDVIPLSDYDFNALSYIDDALEWVEVDGGRHNRSGWNQDPWYFARAVHLAFMEACGSFIPKHITERQKRLGGKRINKLCGIE